METTGRRTPSWLKWTLGLLVAVGFVAVFLWGYITPKRVEASLGRTKTKTTVGTFSGHSYVLAVTENQKERSAEFNPPLNDDDALVVGAMRNLMQTSYADQKNDDIQPVVEIIDEKLNITFSDDHSKTYFQLYKNSGGEVGSIRFWREGK